MFACLLSDWSTTTGRLLGSTTCLPHKDGGMPLSAFPMDTTSKLAGKPTITVVMIRQWLFLIMYREYLIGMELYLTEEQMVFRWHFS